MFGFFYGFKFFNVNVVRKKIIFIDSKTSGNDLELYFLAEEKSLTNIKILHSYVDNSGLTYTEYTNMLYGRTLS
jgi:hypothetical protein